MNNNNTIKYISPTGIGMIMIFTGLFISYGGLTGRLPSMLAAIFDPSLLTSGQAIPTQIGNAAANAANTITNFGIVS